MSNRTWFGGIGDWYAASDWTTDSNQSGAPIPGDTLAVNAGTITLQNSEAEGDGLFDNVIVNIGQQGPVTFDLDSAKLGPGFDIDDNGTFSLLTSGQSMFDGVISATGSGDVVTLGAVAGGTSPAGLTLLTDAYIDATTLVVAGAVTIEARESSDISNLDVTATFALIDTFVLASSVQGGGTIDLGLGGTLEVSGGASNNTTFAFTDVGGELDIDAPADFAGAITGFQPGDTIDLTNLKGDDAVYDPTNHTLELLQSAADPVVLAKLNNVSAAPGALEAVSDGSGGTDIVYASASPTLAYELAAGDRAMGAEIVRNTMTVPGTNTPITGAGVKIGIISDSFDYHASSSPDPANAAAAAGFIPATANGASAVQVLKDYSSSYATNEGLAMAELIHQVAPGATLAFATGETNSVDFASAVTALQNAGCNIIVDDLGNIPGPVYQVTGPVDLAVSNAIASGVDYFTSAGNSNNDFLSSAFTPTQATLPNGAAATANLFDNGTVYESIDPKFGATYLALNWAAPYFGPSNTNAPAELKMELFNSSGQLKETSNQYTDQNDSGVNVSVSEDYLYVPAGGPYTLAIVQNGAVAPSQFLLTDVDDYGAIIEDPQAGSGAGEVSEQELIPGVNTVGAAPYASSPAFNQSGMFPETFSDAGPGEILYDSNGNPLSAPVSAGKVDFTAPDGEDTSVVSPTGFDFAPFYGTSAAAPDAAAVAALMLQANPNLTTTQVTQLLEQSAVPLTNTSAAEGGAGLVQAVPAVQLAEEAACYVRGTRILTLRGEIAIEALQVGDLAVTQSGERRPVRWLGHRRIDMSRHRDPAAVRPVRVQAGAFADGLPRRELWLSPGHNIASEGALMPISALVNGRSVAQIEVDRVEYWHVELDAHDVIFAEGLPAESYLDTGNRAAFANGGLFVEAHPDFAPRHWTDTCLPLVQEGQAVTATKARLLARLAEAGCGVTQEADAHVSIDGLRVEPIRLSETRLGFVLASGGREIALRSSTFVPAHSVAESRDTRTLGLCVAALQIDGAAIALDDDREPGSGWAEAEFAHGRFTHRWTTGSTQLPAGARIVIVDLAGEGSYWATSGDEVAAALTAGSARARSAMGLASARRVFC